MYGPYKKCMLIWVECSNWRTLNEEYPKKKKKKGGELRNEGQQRKEHPSVAAYVSISLL